MKVGDKVRVIKDLSDGEITVFSAGTIGVITEYHEYGYDYPYRVTAEGKSWWYPADALEAVD